MNGPAGALSVAARIDALLAGTEALKASQAPDPGNLAAALRELDWLRARYAENSAPFANRLEALRLARSAIDELIQTSMASIAEAFVAASDALRREEARRDHCRSLLLRLHESGSVTRWEVGEVEVLVQRFASVELPDIGTPARAALEQQLEQLGRWRAVSILHRPALAKAFESGTIGQEERAALEQWCKIGGGYRVSIRQREAGPPLPELAPEQERRFRP